MLKQHLFAESVKKLMLIQVYDTTKALHGFNINLLNPGNSFFNTISRNFSWKKLIVPCIFLLWKKFPDKSIKTPTVSASFLMGF